VLAQPSGTSRNQAARGSHLVFTFNRDGDDDLYAVDARGGRVAALTRNRVQDDEFTLDERTGWVAIVRNYSSIVLVSRDGRRERSLGEADSPVFSRNGRFLAFAREPLDAETSHIKLLAVQNGKVRALGAGRPLAFSPSGRLLAFASDHGIGVVDVVSGRRRMFARSARAEFVGWSPNGRTIAFERRRKRGGDISYMLLVADARRPKVVRRVLEGWFEARWLTSQRLGYERDTGPGAANQEIGVASSTGAEPIVLARGDVSHPQWSPRGERVAYTRRIDERTSALVVASLTRRQERTILTASGVDARWSPSGRWLAARAAESDRAALVLFSADGRRQRTLVESGDPNLDSWSPDERYLAISTQTGLGVLAVRARTLWRLPNWDAYPVRWVRGPLPRRAPAVPPVPPSELAQPRQLRSRAPVLELSADATRVAVLVGWWRSDCEHIAGWTAGTRRIVRLGHQDPCGDHPRPYAFGLDLVGTRATFRSFSCGNQCYVAQCEGDLWRRDVRCGDEEGTDDMNFRRPASPAERRSGVAIQTRLGGEIQLRRELDGRMRTIRPPGGAADAELEDAGLFYAFNTRGKFRGHVIFLPFAELFP
jgi:Tol biopolymer transport system component